MNPYKPADVITMLNMRFFTSSGVNRVDIRVSERKAVAVKAASNSVVPPEGVELLKDTSVVAVKIPVSAMGGAGLMMINVDTFNDRETEDDWLDRTVWRRIEL